ncbi:MAG: hypothetical protein EA401_08205 [Planctomycetota bacterium]|nr:MAG: hypothetical protein EA401_08205 [Planctomycetota bacterium]
MTHRWHMSRMGTLDQVRFLGAADLNALPKLDYTVWVALVCPLHGLDMDQRTLELIDRDGDRGIRVPEILAAVQYVCEHLRDPGVIFTPGDRLPLEAIDDSHESGARLVRSARRILADLDTSKQDSVGIEDSGDLLRILSAARFNGDGVVTTSASDHPEVISAIEDMLRCYGGVIDRSGNKGVDSATVTRFHADLQAFDQWWRGAEDGTESARELLPLGDDTPQAVAAWMAVRHKIDDFFSRCRLSAYDPSAQAVLGQGAANWHKLAGQELATLPPEVAELPLQAPDGSGTLRLDEVLNPAWSEAIQHFRRSVCSALAGDISVLHQDTWQQICTRLEPHWRWSQAKAAPAVEQLGIIRIRALLDSDELTQIQQLIGEDLAVADEVDGIADVDRLLRYRRDLARLLRNFVNFDEFYRLDRQALFQAGYLYLDQRRANLVLEIDNPDLHAPFAALSRCCVVYCRCQRAGQTPMTIAAVLTRGDLSQLMPGRGGIYYDRQGRDWDATVIRIVEAPINIRQAFWSPWRKLANFIETQAERLASAKQDHVDETLGAGIGSLIADGERPATTARTPFDIARFVGIFAAIGLAIGAIGGAMGSMLAAFSRLAWWQIPLALLGIMMVVSGPAMVLAWLKLRSRTLGPLLEGCGWAINGRVHITRPLGQVLTQRKRLPPGSRRVGTDPYGVYRWQRWTLVIIFATLFIGCAWWYRWHLSQPAMLPEITPIEQPAGE